MVCLLSCSCNDVSSSIERYKPGVVYYWRLPPSVAPLPDTNLSSDPAVPRRRRSTKVTHKPDRYGFPHTLLTVTLDTISVPRSYDQLTPTGSLLSWSLAGLQLGKSVLTPLEVNLKFRQEEGELLSNPSLYRQFVGSLNYLTITLPNISFVVQQVSQFMQTPRHIHLAVVRHIIRYLKAIPNRGLFFPKESSLQLVGYSDADWAGCTDTRCFVRGWCMFLGNVLISWKSKKQDRVFKSSTESVYRAMSSACSGFQIDLIGGSLDPVTLASAVAGGYLDRVT
ncbi:hypothetical protein F2P56_019733 [Juglans regia]|uniref:Mitochondrial protein n=1 Tax=Juglans regia TaxID=51240 RepID=A0A833X4X5_JUGRE|nr:hypothetical protein F2P56_019733 [Juglans regia]